MDTVVELSVDEIQERDDLYPRKEINAVMVQKYAEDLDVLPPVEVNQNKELIDGKHRLTAYKKKKRTTIPCVITNTSDDTELLEFAIERNNRHGYQLSNSDKRRMAGTIYKKTPIEHRGVKKDRLSEILSVSPRTIHNWVNDIDRDDQEERNATILDLYLQCWTQEEIAEAVFGDNTDATKKKVDRLWDEIAKLQICPKPGLFSEDAPDRDAPDRVKKAWDAARQEKIIQHNTDNANHEIDFKIPIYNIWTQNAKSEGVSHFGNSEVRWVDNLLYLYTKPFDIVVDPFAGSGSTLDMCRKRFRRCWISDRKPIPERTDIRELDIVTGLPELNKRWSDVRLVYLDPPYWKQAEGQYSDDEEDLANMDLDDFNKNMVDIINAFKKKLSTDAYIALIIQPTQWKAPGREFTDHVLDIVKRVNNGLSLHMRYSAPYSTEQCNAQMVQWAKDNKQCLVLSREIIVWSVS